MNEIEYFRNTFVLDRKLYKYFGNAENAIKAVRNKGFHLDNPINYNDPFDISNDVRSNYRKGKNCSIIKSSCFSEFENSIIMWSYYGNNGKGICLEYDFSKLDYNEETKEIKKHIVPIHYSNIRVIGNYDERNLLSNINFAISKSEEWKHEREWRFICKTEKEFLNVDCITKVYLGYNYEKNSRSYIELLKAIKKYDDLLLCESILDKKEFKITNNVIAKSFDKEAIDKDIVYYENQLKNKLIDGVKKY